MAVYVDPADYPYGHMLLCYMIADTEAELHAMADRIRVARRWYRGDHYDICKSKRALAVAAGAREVTSRELTLLRRAQRRARLDAEESAMARETQHGGL